MADVRVIVDEHEYSEDQFKKDLIRMFDTYRYHDSGYMGEPNCKGVVCSINCPLGVEGKCCNVTDFESFETIKIVYKWAQEHPTMTNTNQKKFKEVFGEKAIDKFDEYVHVNSSGFYEWMEQEYKKPKGGNKNG